MPFVCLFLYDHLTFQQKLPSNETFSSRFWSLRILRARLFLTFDVQRPEFHKSYKLAF